jgi:DNA-binding CsgD family transcriptional regulator
MPTTPSRERGPNPARAFPRKRWSPRLSASWLRCRDWILRVDVPRITVGNISARNWEEPMPRQLQKPLQHAPERNDPLVRESFRLSPRERQVLDLLGKGRTTKEIAVILNLSTATVGNHRKSICRKLNVHSTAALIYRASLGSQ